MSQTIGEQWLKGQHEEFIAGRQQYLTRSRARERTVIWSHSLRNVLLSVVTISGVQIGRTLGGLAVLTLIAAAAVLAPWIVRWRPGRWTSTTWSPGPSAAHWLGSDEMGRDTLARLTVGADRALGRPPGRWVWACC